MALSSDDLRSLSRLLDEALELGPGEAESWLLDLDPSVQHLVPHLRGALSRPDDTSGFLQEGPSLESSDGSVAREGDQVGPYRLIRELGQGGMGAVWLAAKVDGRVKRNVALKLPRLAWGAGLAERMRRERDIGALLEHPNIARLYDAGVDEKGRPYLALEHIDGVPLDAWCRQRDPSVSDKLKLFLQIARAVAYAHGRLVVHRDLKPSNVLVTPDGQAHLLDFGIAKLLDDAANEGVGLTEQYGQALTPQYASPEQLRGETITVQTDIYSLGAVLYRLLTGDTPQPGRRNSLPAAIQDASDSREPPLASSCVSDAALRRKLAGELDAILAQALRHDPARRYGTAAALADDIESHLSGERVLAQPDSVWYRATKVLRRHRTVFAAAVVVLVAIVVSGTVALIQFRNAARAAEQQRLVTDFVSEVFRVNSGSRDTSTPSTGLTGDRLAQHGAMLIRTRFASSPELQAQLYGTVGRMFTEMGAGPQAVAFATQGVEAMKAYAPSPRDRAAASLTLAQALIESENFPEAEKWALDAMAIIGPGGMGYADALVALARALLDGGRHAEATARVAELVAEVAKETRPSIAGAWLHCLHASLLDRADRYEEKAPHTERCVAVSRQVEGQEAATIRFEIEHSYSLSYHDIKRSKAMSDAALSAARTLGGPIAIYAARAATHLASSNHEFGLVAAADVVRVHEASRTFLSTQPMVPDRVLAAVDFDAGFFALNRGDFVAARRLMTGRLDALLAPSGSLDDRRRTLFRLAWLDQHLGFHDKVPALIAEAVPMSQSVHAEGHRYAAFVPQILAENLAYSGDHSAALRVLDAAARDFPRGPTSAEVNESGYTRLLRTRMMVLSDGGDHDAALKIWLELPHQDLDAGFWQDHAVKARSGCARGEIREALSLNDDILALMSRDMVEVSPQLARMRAEAGLCRLAGGDVATAKSLAGQARSALDAQPFSSPYFRRPLIELDRQLSTQRPRPRALVSARRS